MAKTNNSEFPNPASPNPPGVWLPARKGVQRILAPVERFLAIEAASGIRVDDRRDRGARVGQFSLARRLYADLWHIPIGIRFGSFAFERDLHFWINDGLMTIFFFVVGLEIRREIHAGELSEVRRAALPLAAALGGMLVPALIFLALNFGRPSASGWAVPMATDIAFAVGALALLGKTRGSRASHSAVGLGRHRRCRRDSGDRTVLLDGLAAIGFVVLGLGIIATFVMQILGVRSPLAYVGPGYWSGPAPTSAEFIRHSPA